jgi:hypothetical protein
MRSRRLRCIGGSAQVQVEVLKSTAGTAVKATRVTGIEADMARMCRIGGGKM